MTIITDTVPDGIAALRDLCDALSPDLAAGIQCANAYEGDLDAYDGLAAEASA